MGDLLQIVLIDSAGLVLAAEIALFTVGGQEPKKVEAHEDAP